VCGILGYVSWRNQLPAVDQLRRVTNLLRHRGPDGGGYWCNGQAFLGHRRLSIIDLESGQQPMVSADGRWVISCNGEIYNYVELREELKALGHTFRTNSDTEVVLAGYREWGTEVAVRLVGMFALAIYDQSEQTVYLARDRFGEKPLLLAPGSHRLVFASELAPITAIFPGTREIDQEALAGYLCLNYVPGQRTMLRGVERLSPGEWRVYGEVGLVRRSLYWSPPSEPASSGNMSDGDTLDVLQERLDRAIQITLRSDVPVGLFLSGGVDSSVVAESAVRQGRLECGFCLDVGETGFSELPAATQVARHLDLELVRVPFTEDVLDEFMTVSAHADDPLADSSAMAVWTIARAASDRLKVVLSGDGGDELFAGYLTYAASVAHSKLTAALPLGLRRSLTRTAEWIPTNDRRKVSWSYRLQRFLRALDLSTAEAHFTWNGTWLPEEAAQLLRDGIDTSTVRDSLRRLAKAHALPDHPTVHALQCADAGEYLPNDILTKVDRMTMGHGLESRAPLLNPTIAELALSLPPHLRVHWRRGLKVSLRSLCERHFGAKHARAPKQGFSIPIHRWLCGRGRNLLVSVLDRSRVDAVSVLDPVAIDAAVSAHLSGRRAIGWELWGLMVFVVWHETRVASPPRPDQLPDCGDLKRVA